MRGRVRERKSGRGRGRVGVVEEGWERGWVREWKEE